MQLAAPQLPAAEQQAQHTDILLPDRFIPAVGRDKQKLPGRQPLLNFIALTVTKDVLIIAG